MCVFFAFVWLCVVSKISVHNFISVSSPGRGKPWNLVQELSYRKQIARQLRTIRRGHLRDLEIYVKGHSRSLETEPLDRSYTTYY